MQDLIHADLFFFVTTIAVMIVTIVGVVVAVYAIKILHDVKAITRRVRAETDLVAADIAGMRTQIGHLGLLAFLARLMKQQFDKASTKR